MGILARAGEKIKGRDGKVIATVASDIHSGDINVRANQFTFTEGNEVYGASLPEEIYQFIRDRLAEPVQDALEESRARGDGTPGAAAKHDAAVGQTQTVADANRSGKAKP